jgi:hypothetical protein
MSGPQNRKYVDHPAPSIGLMAIHIVAYCGLIAAIPALLHAPSSGEPTPSLLVGRAVILLSLAVLSFYFWPLYSTYYTVSSAGIQVRYGPWTRQYPWSDFLTAYWQKGMFCHSVNDAVRPAVRCRPAQTDSKTIRSVPDSQRFERFPPENQRVRSKSDGRNDQLSFEQAASAVALGARH